MNKHEKKKICEVIKMLIKQDDDDFDIAIDELCELADVKHAAASEQKTGDISPITFHEIIENIEGQRVVTVACIIAHLFKITGRESIDKDEVAEFVMTVQDKLEKQGFDLAISWECINPTDVVSPHAFENYFSEWKITDEGKKLLEDYVAGTLKLKLTDAELDIIRNAALEHLG